eukprot:COSAG06_NODE_877_length_11814_cov_7.238327_1_plen_32_part_00
MGPETAAAPARNYFVGDDRDYTLESNVGRAK